MDFAWVTSDGPFLSSTAHLRVAYSRGDGKFDVVEPTITQSPNFVDAQWTTADLDGDHADEIVQVLTDGSTTTIRSLDRTAATLWTGTSVPLPLPDAPAGSGRWQSASISGGERAEFLRITPGPGIWDITIDTLRQSAGSWATNSQTVSLGTLGPTAARVLHRGRFEVSDLNADGTADLVRVARRPNTLPNGSTISHGLNISQLVATGRPGQFALASIDVDPPSGLWVYPELGGAKWMTGDIDNDGLEDFVQIARGSGLFADNYVHVLHRTGLEGMRWERFALTATTGADLSDTPAWTLLDFVGANGSTGPDGQVDLVRPYTSTTGTIAFAAYGADSATPRIVRQQSGYGLDTELTYVSSKGKHAGLPIGMAETNVASLRRSVKPTGEMSYLAFAYDGFRYDHATQRSLGFGEATAQSSIHVAAGARLRVVNLQDPLCPGRRKLEEFSLQGTGAALMKTSLAYAKSTANNNYSCRVETETNTHYEYGGSPLTTRKRFDADAFGNVSTIWDQGQYVDSNGDEIDDFTDDNRTTTVSFVPNFSKYLVSFPSETIRTGHLGQIVGKERFLYDNFPFGSAPTRGDATRKEAWDDQSSTWVGTNVSYWPSGAPRRVEGPTGIWEETTFDPDLGLFPASVCNDKFCNSQAWSARYGKLDLATDANNEETDYQYDAFGRLVRTVFQDGACLMHSWGNLGNPSQQYSFEGVCRTPNEEPNISTSLGVVTYFDGMMRPWKQTRQNTYERLLSHWGTTTLPRSADTWHAIGATGEKTETFYEYQGRPVRVVNPDGSERRIGYWPAHVSTEDENGNIRELFRDARGNLAVAREWYFNQSWSAQEATYEYDDADRLTRATDALGNDTTAQFTSLGWRTQSCDPDRGCFDLTYYADGRLWTSTDNRGLSVEFVYDGLGRLEVRSTNRGGRNVILQRNYWDEDPYTGQPSGFSLGRVTRRIDESGESAYTYDNRGRPYYEQRTTNVQGQSAFAEWSTYYDLVGRRRSIQYPDSSGHLSPHSELVEYKYDDLGRTRRIYSQFDTYLEDAKYAADDRLEVAAFGNGVSENAYYDRYRKWLTGIEVLPAQGDGLTLSYEYDLGGRPIRHTWSDPSFHELNLTYDSLGRLTEVAGELSQTFAYDTVGRMTYNSSAGGSYAYGATSFHAVTRAGAYLLSYDSAGNAEAIDSNRYDWNEDGQLIGGSTPKTALAWGYDPDGTRLYKKSGGDPTYYFGEFVELDPSGMKYYYKLGDKTIAERTANGLEWIHRDLVNSTRATSDASGGIAKRFDYEPFGSEYLNGVPPDLGYRSERFDEDTGLVLLGARYYHPRIGRFISADSIIPDLENPQAHDRYSYVYNSPIGLVDPSGHAPKEANQQQQEQLKDKGSTEAKKPQVPLHEYCKTHPDDAKCASPITDSPRYPFDHNVKRCFDIGGLSWGQVKAMHPIEQVELARQTELVTGVNVDDLPVFRDAQAKVELYERMETANAMLGVVALSTGLETKVALGVSATTMPPILSPRLPPQKAIRRVGDLLQSVDDVVANPGLLKGKHPGEVSALLKKPGWKVETLGKGSQKGNGWVLRQYTPKGNATGQQIRWHPGGGHHGPGAYWRVITNTSNSGIIR